MKLHAWLAEDASRCSSCGTADWEWEADRFAYIADVHVCQGCALREQSRELVKNISGGSIRLLSGAAKAAALVRQRDEYLARARAKREAKDVT